MDYYKYYIWSIFHAPFAHILNYIFLYEFHLLCYHYIIQTLFFKVRLIIRIGQCDGLVPWGKKPLPGIILTNIPDAFNVSSPRSVKPWSVITQYHIQHSNCRSRQWASYHIYKIAVARAPGMPGTFSPPSRISDPDMHHGMIRDR